MSEKSGFRLFKGNKTDKKEIAKKPPLKNENFFSTNENKQKTLPHTMLSLTLEQKLTYSDSQIQELQKRLDTLPPLNVGELNFYPVEAGASESGGYYVNVFIRNGAGLEVELSVDSVRLFLQDAAGNRVAGGQFQLPEFQSLKFGESRYWTFIWRPEEVTVPNADLSSFSIAFGE